MKKLRLFMFLALITMLTLLVLSGCKKEDGVASVFLKDHDPDTVIEVALGEFDYNSYTVVVSYESGNTEEIALTEEMIAETDLFKLYQIGDHEITIHYGKQTYTFKLSVKRATFGELVFPENNVFTYDGKEHVVEVDGNLPANAVVTYLGGNSFVNAGTYDVAAIVSCEGYVTQKLSTTVKIEQAKYDMSGVKFEGKEVVYDGTSHSVAISGKLPDGVSSPTYTINGKVGSSATNAGEYKVKATFANSDPNYEAIPEMETTLKITPTEYTVKGVDIVFKSEGGNVISGATKIYDGKSITFDLNDYSKLSKKITVSFAVYDKDRKVISTSNKKTNILEVGVYTARVEFTMADGNNYKPIPPIERTFEVLKAEYPSLQNIHFLPSQSPYDGKAHSIEIEGQLPAGVTVSYEYYKDGKLLVDGENKPVQSVVDVGRYNVKAIFAHTDTNRNEIASISSVLNIMAVSFNVSNLSAELNGSDVYDGTEKTVTVIGQLPDEINFVVIYYQNRKIMENADGSYATSVIEPGEYYVYVQFVSTSNNYVITGMLEYTFTIKKATINLYDIERDGDREYIYNGDNQSPSIKNGTLPNHVNVTEQLFRIDANGNRTAVGSAVNVGKYVKVITATLDDPTRYQFSNSGVIEWAFEISPITIVDIDSLPEDFYIEVPDNDGWYVWSEDDSVIGNAISNAIFREYSNHADIYSLMTPKDTTTDTWLQPPNNSININTIYDLECNVSVDSNYSIICGGQPQSGRFLITIKIKFIINNNI
ncbi:MAG: hypothetical protein J6Q78_02780 [Clostridia bacterium]|nr:hypothetical protein [Clostridia bacterium]